MSTEASVGSIMIDCNDIEAVVEFWSAVLDLEVKARYPSYVFMSRVCEGGPALAFQQVPVPRAGKNRTHIDLSAVEPEAFIEKAIELGASRIEDHELSGFHWTVLADPEGNVFCVSKAH